MILVVLGGGVSDQARLGALISHHIFRGFNGLD